MHEKYVKRIVYTAKCDYCDFKDIRLYDPPREIICPTCSKWIEYKEESYIGPELNGKN